MKYYKLLKDLPTFKAGDLFYINPDQRCLVQKDTLILAYAKKTLENFPNALTGWFEKIEESENKRWRGKLGETYWFLSDNGSLYFKTEDNNKIDNYRYRVGNYFKTIEEARTYKKYLLARQTILDDAEGGEYFLGENKWYAFYSILTREWTISMNISYHPGVIYFRNRKSLEKSLEEHEKQWEIVRKYEMGE